MWGAGGGHTAGANCKACRIGPRSKRKDAHALPGWAPAAAAAAALPVLPAASPAPSAGTASAASTSAADSGAADADRCGAGAAWDAAAGAVAGAPAAPDCAVVAAAGAAAGRDALAAAAALLPCPAWPRCRRFLQGHWSAPVIVVCTLTGTAVEPHNSSTGCLKATQPGPAKRALGQLASPAPAPAHLIHVRSGLM